MTSRRRLLLPLAVAVFSISSALVTGAVTSGAPAAGATRGPSKPSAPVCGGSKTLVTSSKTWTCTFDDEFNNSSLDSSKWMAQTTATSGWTTSDTCYVNSPSTISESNGALHLVAQTTSSPTQCGTAYSTNHIGGAVMSYNRFSQTYGRFEIRAKFPDSSQTGFWGNLWLYPQTLTYGAWPASGEVDIAEHWSGHSAYTSSTLHYTNSTGADSQACSSMDLTQFHTYRVEWTSSVMNFYYDDALCFSRSWTATTGSSMPFDKPFFLILSEGFGDFNQTATASTLLPSSGPVDVDYVRVYS